MTTKAKAPRVRLAYKRQRCLDDHGSVQSGQKRKLRKLGTAESDEVNSVPTKQRASPASDQSPASSTTVQVTCRSEETVKLAKTLFECLTNQQGTGIYVPGQPGTGKTHTIRAVLESLPCTQLGVTHPAMALINCTDRQRCTLGKAILAGIYDSAARLKEDCSGRGCLSSGGHKVDGFRAPDGQKIVSNDSALQYIRSIARGSAKFRELQGMCIVVLDELELACKHSMGFIQGLFALTKLKHSRLVVVGIANRLDLSQQLLGNGDSAVPLTIVAFHSYNARQLLDLLKERYADRIDNKGLELVAKRISAASGDMRAAMSVCETALARFVRAAEPAVSNAVRAAEPAAPRPTTGCIPVSTIAAALQECRSGGSAQAQTQVAAIRALPGQQQLLLCTLAIARGSALPVQPSTPVPAAVSTPLKAKPALHSAFAVRSGLGKGKPAVRTPLGSRNPNLKGFTTPSKHVTPFSKTPTSMSFPMAEDSILPTPTSTPFAAKSASAARNADLTLHKVFQKYCAAAKEAGLAPVPMPQLQTIVGDLQASGLLETRGRVPLKTTSRIDSLRIGLAVSTQDVKHALADTRMLQPLVRQLP